jgi:hypothetical protein
MHHDSDSDVELSTVDPPIDAKRENTPKATEEAKPQLEEFTEVVASLNRTIWRAYFALRDLSQAIE